MKRIKLVWIQKGHSTLDPGGSRLFNMTCTWTCCPEDNLKEMLNKASDYASQQLHWVSYKIIVE